MGLVNLFAISQSWSDSLWLVFTWFILVPVLATGLIVVSIVSGRSEKRDNEKYASRWGRAGQRRNSDDG